MVFGATGLQRRKKGDVGRLSVEPGLTGRPNLVRLGLIGSAATGNPRLCNGQPIQKTG
jgi:hypothetical protein